MERLVLVFGSCLAILSGAEASELEVYTVDTDGMEIVGVRVTAWSPDATPNAKVHHSNANGLAAFDLEPGTYELYADWDDKPQIMLSVVVMDETKRAIELTMVECEFVSLDDPFHRRLRRQALRKDGRAFRRAKREHREQNRR